jgi:hypothetical protein
MLLESPEAMIEKGPDSAWAMVGMMIVSKPRKVVFFIVVPIARRQLR